MAAWGGGGRRGRLGRRGPDVAPTRAAPARRRPPVTAGAAPGGGVSEWVARNGSWRAKTRPWGPMTRTGAATATEGKQAEKATNRPSRRPRTRADATFALRSASGACQEAVNNEQSAPGRRDRLRARGGRSDRRVRRWLRRGAEAPAPDLQRPAQGAERPPVLHRPGPAAGIEHAEDSDHAQLRRAVPEPGRREASTVGLQPQPERARALVRAGDHLDRERRLRQLPGHELRAAEGRLPAAGVELLLA